MRRTKILIGFALLALVAMLAPVSNRNQAFAGEFTCKQVDTTACTGFAMCRGDHFAKTGACAITCYVDVAESQGQIAINGTATCPSSSARPAGSGPGSN